MKSLWPAVFAAFGMLGPTFALAVEPDSDGFVSLFDGKTLDGWKQLGGKAKYVGRGRGDRRLLGAQHLQQLPLHREELRRLHPRTGVQGRSRA